MTNTKRTIHEMILYVGILLVKVFGLLLSLFNEIIG